MKHFSWAEGPWDPNYPRLSAQGVVFRAVGRSAVDIRRTCLPEQHLRGKTGRVLRACSSGLSPGVASSGRPP